MISVFFTTPGIAIRGRIANKIGFYTTLTDNQERYPTYVQDWMKERTAVPGAGFYKDFKAAGGRDFLMRADTSQ
ncbi:hypothetical protein LWM68_33300 [Niabella sp. W65]|nr:hypothetical protein [Niabella sp. W65]MCH7367208.1 hypothetical protein [Niabella sp. W65]ULT42874.1 hypothetical protein KRR40_04810 [Niabella sp. I65]